jgi:hypothetical protein
MKQIFVIILTIIIAVMFTSLRLGAADMPSAKEIVDKGTNAIKLAGSEAISTMVIIDSKGRKRVRKIAMVSKLFDNGDTEKRLMRFLSPADVKGTGFMIFNYEKKDDDQWLFMPALRKTRRIISSEKSKNFMGSEFAYADMSPPNIDDFNYKLLGEEEVNGVLCWKIEMIPINEDVADENGFSKRISYFAKVDHVIRKSIYYDLDNTLHKVMIVKSVEEIDKKNHRYRPLHLEMENKQNGRRSYFKIEKIQLNLGIKDEYFTTRYLERQ